MNVEAGVFGMNVRREKHLVLVTAGNFVYFLCKVPSVDYLCITASRLRAVQDISDLIRHVRSFLEKYLRTRYL